MANLFDRLHGIPHVLGVDVTRDSVHSLTDSPVFQIFIRNLKKRNHKLHLQKCLDITIDISAVSKGLNVP